MLMADAHPRPIGFIYIPTHLILTKMRSDLSSITSMPKLKHLLFIMQ